MLDNPRSPSMIIDEEDQLKKVLEAVGPLSDEDIKFADDSNRQGYLKSLQSALAHSDEFSSKFENLSENYM